MRLTIISMMSFLGMSGLDYFLFRNYERHGSFWQQWWGGYGLFGFVICFALIGIAKCLAPVVVEEQKKAQ